MSELTKKIRDMLSEAGVCFGEAGSSIMLLITLIQSLGGIDLGDPIPL